MNTKDIELDKFFTYRLIQVLYYGSLIMGQLFILFITYKLSMPQIFYKYITYDSEKSTFTCASNKKYMFYNTIGTYYTKYIWQSDITSSIKSNKEKLEKFCDSSFDASNYFKEREKRESEILRELGAILVSKSDINNVSNFDNSDQVRTLITPRDIKNVKTIDISYKKHEEHWLKIIIKFISTMLIYYFVLNILRETGIYLCIGKKFTWSWLKIYKKSN